MSGISIIVDTNIVVYLLNGNERVAELLNGNDIYLSFITPSEKRKIQSFIEQCFVIDITSSIKQNVIRLRENNKIKLPDAIIAASAIDYDLPLFTSDKQMSNIKELSAFIIEV